MKLLKYSEFFLGIVFVFLFISQFAQTKTRYVFRSYDSSIEDSLKFDQYIGKYEELTWLDDCTGQGSVCYNKEPNAGQNIYLMLKFLDAMVTGEYLDYLDLYLEEDESRRISYNEFSEFHAKLETMCTLSIFTEEEFKDILFYGLVLGEVENCELFKEKAWVYGTSSLSEVVVMHQDVLPTLQRFSAEQKKFLRLILEGFQFEGFLEKYRNNIAYNVGDKCAFIEENLECFDLSFLMFVCRMAGKYSNAEHSKTRFTSGYYSYLTEFGNELITHLQPSF